MTHEETDTTKRWARLALCAAAVVLLTPFLYVLASGPDAAPPETPAAFVGSEKCKSCHEENYKKWYGSDHRMAMAAATDETVLGDFNDVRYTDTHNHVTSRFFRKDGKFYVETEGPDGAPGTFQVAYTFGVSPLQHTWFPFPAAACNASTSPGT